MTEEKYLELLESVEENPTVFNAMEKALLVLGKDNHKNVSVSVSGGADSDVMIDMCSKIRDDLHYVWFNTGLEYKATKDHLKYLEDRYGIEIKRIGAVMPVPLAVKHYGYPFISKKVSEYIGRLQKHGFKWEDKPFEELYAEYPRCKGALRWWCNEWGEGSQFNIKRWKYLKEFLIQNPPTFSISDGCCKGAKKLTAHKYSKENCMDLHLTGERKAEGGSRVSTNSCFTGSVEDKDAKFRPLYWFKDSDKQWYEEHFDICHSACYWRYGLKRTGCVGCPFGRNWQYELEVAKQYEPKLYKACTNVFRPSYEYTLAYYKFREEMDAKKSGYKQMTIFDY